MGLNSVATNVDCQHTPGLISSWILEGNTYFEQSAVWIWLSSCSPIAMERSLHMTDDPPGLIMAPLVRWLGTHVTDFNLSEYPTVELLAGGRSNLTYRLVDASGKKWAIRRPPLGHIMPSAHDLGRECTVMSALSAHGYPTPRIWALCGDESVIGARFLIMDFVDGVVISDENDALQLDMNSADRVSQILVEGLVNLHKIDPAAVGLANFGKPDGYLERQVRRWGHQWELTKTRDLPLLDKLGAWLTTEVQTLPSGLPTSIVHGDYRIDNAILDADFTELQAVLDWEMSTLGDPISDLAVTLVYWTQANDHLRRDLPVAQDVTSGPGFWTRNRIVESYTAMSGRDPGHLGFCLVLACYKLAVIMESLHMRALQGQQLGRTAERGENMGKATEALAAIGERLLDFPSVEALES